MKTHLIIVDPQNDFCDPQRGSLYVTGAEKDMQALAGFIDRRGDLLDEIHVTLDSHHTLHIAHPIFWKNSQGQHPTPFTTITRADVEAVRWMTSNPSWMERGLAYVRALEKNNRYQLMIWPPHCRIGTRGHSIFPCVSDALLAWEERRFAKVNFLMKGSNIFTEHYSAVVADVPDDADPSTRLNTAFLDTVSKADRILLSGEALSHCVANTVTDIANHFGEENLRKLVLLRDTSSNVTGCEALGENFITEMSKRGMRVRTTGEERIKDK
jgi:nicotinamidase-related amidase